MDVGSKIIRTWKGWTSLENAKKVLLRYDETAQH